MRGIPTTVELWHASDLGAKCCKIGTFLGKRCRHLDPFGGNFWNDGMAASLAEHILCREGQALPLMIGEAGPKYYWHVVWIMASVLRLGPASSQHWALPLVSGGIYHCASRSRSVAIWSEKSRFPFQDLPCALLYTSRLWEYYCLATSDETIKRCLLVFWFC